MMTAKRVSAIFMTLLMLIGMIPAANAELHYYCWELNESCSFGPWMVGREASSCDASDGYEYRVCRKCGYVEERELSGEHDYERVVTSEPTCTEEGYAEYLCSICGSEKGDPEELPALGHDWDDGRVITAATCIRRGEKECTCDRCGKKDRVPTDYGPHSWGDWKLIEEGDCTHPGKEQRVCSLCGEKQTRETEEGSHDWNRWSTKEEPTCTEEGTDARKCRNCGKTNTRKTDALGHDWGEWTVIQEAKIGQVGIRERECKRCGITEQEYFYPDGTIKHGDRGDEVEKLQESLNEQGYDCGAADGIFGNKTEEALKEWQEDHGFNGDGIFWPGQDDEMYGDDEGEQGNVPAGDFEFGNLTKILINTPANGKYFVEGETIVYGICFLNLCEHELHDLEITDPLKGSNEDMVLTIEPVVEPLGSVTVEFSHVVTAEEAAAGSVVNTAYATFWNPEIEEQHSVSSLTLYVTTGVDADSGNTDDDPADGITLTKSVLSTPENGSYYLPGEAIEFRVTITNSSDTDFTDIIVYDPLLDPAELKPYDVLPAGYTDNIDFSYTVTTADADAYILYNYAFIVRPNGADFSDRIYSNTVSCPTGYNYVYAAPPEISYGTAEIYTGGLKLDKYVTSSPANGSFYTPGETVTFAVDVTNTHASYDIIGVKVFDSMMTGFGGVWEAMYISPGATESFTFDYTVTPVDAVNGYITNTATATGIDVDKKEYIAFSPTVTVPTGMDAFGVITAMEVVKEITSSPANGAYYTEGETIDYTITCVNTGETPFANVNVLDVLEPGFGSVGSAAALNPGESFTVNYAYTVTAEDVAKGYVANMAVAKYDIGGGYISSTNSNVVVSDTDGDENTTYIPGSGTIDWEKLRGTAGDETDTCCVIPVFREGYCVEYEICFCTKHAETYGSIMSMAEAAGAENMQMVWEYAYVLWQGDIDAMYEEILAACDTDAMITVMSERTTYLAMVANTQFAYKIAEPGQPDATAYAVANLWQDKCIDLCYLMNTAPSARMDSIFTVCRNVGEPAVDGKCTCTVEEDEYGFIIGTDRYCAIHGGVYDIMDIVITTDGGEAAWAAIRAIWETELNTAYNSLYAGASEEGGMAYLAEYAAYLSWLDAYETELEMIYPDDPDTVAEVMVNTIMRRAIEACHRAE